MVNWSKTAIKNLKRIYDYISPDSKHYALRVKEEITNKVKILNQFPQMGRVVPEIEDQNVREIFCFSYRIIYELLNDKSILILNIFQGSQDTSDPNKILN